MKPASTIRRALSILALAVAVLVGLGAIAAAVLLATPAGPRWTAAVAHHYVPALSIDRASGTWLTAVTLGGVHYASEALEADLGTVVIAPDFGALVAGRIAFDRIEARDGRVTLAPTPRAGPAALPYAAPELPRLPAGFALRALRISNVDVSASGTVVAVHEASASAAGSDVSLESLEASAFGADLSASASAHLGRDAAGHVEATVTLPSASDGAEKAPRAELVADVALRASADPWSVRVEWSRFALAGLAGGVESTRGTLVATLGSAPVEVTLDTRVEGGMLPGAAEIEAEAELPDLTHVRLARLDVGALGGTIAARGDLALDPPRGKLIVELASLDPSALERRLSGELGGHFDVRFATKPELRVKVVGNLHGRAGEHELAGGLDASYGAAALEIDRADVTLGASRIEAHGSWTSERADLDFHAAIPELASWYPPASGSLEASAAVSGDPGRPTVAAHASAEHIGLEGAPLELERVTVALDGTLASHSLAVAARSAQGSLHLRAEEGWRGNTLEGRLLSAELEASPIGTWSLVAPFIYRASGAAVEIGSACFAGPAAARLCGAAGDSRATVSGHDLPSSLLAPWFPESVRASGAAELDASYAWRGKPTGMLTLRQPSLVLTQTQQGESRAAFTAKITDIALTGTLDERRLEAQLSAAVPGARGRVDANVSVAPPARDGVLTGRLDAHIADLAAADALSESVDDLEGTIDARLTVGGTPASPAVDGEIDVRSLAARLPSLNVELMDGRLHAAAMGLDSLKFDGQLCSEGCVRVDGRLALGGGAPAWRLHARVDGDKFLAANRDDLHAVVAPALALDATPDLWRLMGDVAVSEGVLVIDGVPRSAVRPASGTVVHGRAAPATEDAGGVLPLAFDVDTTIDNLHVDGLGAAADVRGVLRVRQPLGGSLDVMGTLTLLDGGTFTAYGQQLMLAGGGQFIFTGASDNPALDLRATREVGGATVGLRITGTALDIKSEVFSEPMLGESEALSRLMTGHSLASAGAADSQALQRAAVGLGIKRALPALDRAGEKIGLDELGVQGPGETEGAIVAGKQLGRDLYLRYKHGLFDDFAGLELIYRLTQHFRLRTETGTSQSIDLVYDSRGRGGLGESGFPTAGPGAGAAAVAGAPEAAQ